MSTGRLINNWWVVLEVMVECKTSPVGMINNVMLGVESVSPGKVPQCRLRALFTCHVMKGMSDMVQTRFPQVSD